MKRTQSLTLIALTLAGGLLVSARALADETNSAASKDQWTVPLGGGIGKIQWFGKLPINFQIQAFDNVVTPHNGPAGQLRFQVQFLFPK